MAPKKVKKSPTKPGKKSNARDSLSKNSIGRDIPLTTHPSSSTAIAKAAEKFAAIASSPEEESEEFQPTKKTQQSSRETDAVSEVPTEGSKGEIKRWEGKSKASRSIRSNVTQAELPFQVADLSKDQLIDTILHLVHLSLPSDHRDSFESFKKSVVSLDPSRVDPNVQARARWMRRVQDLTLKARPATQNEIVYESYETYVEMIQAAKMLDEIARSARDMLYPLKDPSNQDIHGEGKIYGRLQDPSIRRIQSSD